MMMRTTTVEAQLSPGVTSPPRTRGPRHGRQVLICHPDEGMTPSGVRMRPCGRPGRGCGNQEHRERTQRPRFYALAFPGQPPSFVSRRLGAVLWYQEGYRIVERGEAEAGSRW
jgi:hypothetical protein